METSNICRAGAVRRGEQLCGVPECVHAGLQRPNGPTAVSGEPVDALGRTSNAALVRPGQSCAARFRALLPAGPAEPHERVQPVQQVRRDVPAGVAAAAPAADPKRFPASRDVQGTAADARPDAAPSLARRHERRLQAHRPDRGVASTLRGSRVRRGIRH